MTEETTSTVRGWGGLMFWIGAIAFFTPVSPLGIVLAIVGGVMWLAAPLNSQRTQQMIDEVEADSWGCGPAFGAVLFVVIVMGSLLVALLAMVEGGML